MKIARERLIKNLALEITKLWNRLEVTPEEKQVFLEAHSGLGHRTVRAVR